jgi:hypothetical protein
MNETSTPEVNSRQFWESYMASDWDANSGRQQTRLFAKYFLDAVTLPADAKTLLDVSCAKGDAIPEFHARYPNLQLFGADISEVAIEEARRSFGGIAQFEVAGFDDLTRRYDVIFCSNTLEHFVNNVEVAGGLLTRCRWLHILVPYLEKRGGKRLTAVPGEQHVCTFDAHSFDALIRGGAARRIRHWVRHTPGAWGTGPVSLWTRFKAVLRGRDVPINHRQIFYEITSAQAPGQADN